MTDTSEDTKSKEKDKCERCGGGKTLFNNAPCPECQPIAAARRKAARMPEKLPEDLQAEEAVQTAKSLIDKIGLEAALPIIKESGQDSDASKIISRLEAIANEYEKMDCPSGTLWRDSVVDTLRGVIRESKSDQTKTEKRKGPPPTDWDEIYTGYGRKFKRIEGTSALREVDNDSPDWDQCVYHMIGGRVQRFRMDDTPDPTKGNPNV